MFTFSDNNDSIYSLLEEKKQLPPEFEDDHVYSFEEGDDFWLVIYAGSARDFYLFIAPNFRQEASLAEVLAELQTLEIPLSISLLDQATFIIEDQIRSLGNTRFFFDAH
jgi:hypothetical protein